MSAEEYSLTPNQFRFCEFYIQTSNGTLSSKLAGYGGKDDNSHASMASRLLRNVKIRKYLAKRYAEVAMATDEVLARLAKMARASVADYIDDTGKVDWKKVAKDGYAVKSVTRTKGKNAKIEIEGRLRALELIGKAQAMFTDKLEVAGGDSPIRVRVEYSNDYTPPSASDSKGGHRQQRIEQRAGERPEVGEDTPGA
jgi:hypothetical protein